MKKAKNKFDDLVGKIQQGENVSFGQMEDVFAQAFLSRFLRRLSSEQERRRANKFYQEHLVDQEALQEYYESDEADDMSTDQQIQYELEVARSVMGTLGVRPSTEDLSHYIEHAVRGRDWALLDNVLSLTQEGSMGKGVIEKVALEDLLRGRDESYSELRDHFGDLRFSEEVVRSLYEEAATRRNFEGIGRLRNETHFPVPEEICQATYESLLENFSERTIPQLLALRNVTGVSPGRTEAVGNNLLKVFSDVDLSPEAVDTLDELFEIYSQKVNSAVYQRAALDGKHFQAFEHLYTNSEGKIAAIRLKEKYKEWNEEGEFDRIFHILEVTGVQPTKDILNRGYNDFFAKGRYDVISRVAEKTGRKPHFDEEKVEVALAQARTIARIATSGRLDDPRIKGFLDALQSSKNGLDARLIQELGLQYFKSSEGSLSFEEAYGEVRDFFSAYKVSPPSEITSIAVSHLAADFNEGFSDLEAEFESDVLQPIKGMNVSQYNKFRGKVSKLVRGYSKQVRDLTKSDEAIEIEDSPAIQGAYTRSLELLLVQCERNEQRMIGLEGLQQVTGVPISKESVVTALARHVRRYAQLSENPESLLERVAESAGMDVQIDEHDINRLVQDVLGDRTDFGHSARLNYLAKLAPRVQFSAETKEQVQKVATKALLQKNFNEYGSLVTYLDERFNFSEEQMGALRQKARTILRDEHMSNYDELQKRVPAQLVSSTDVERIAVDLLNLPERSFSLAARYDFPRYDALKGKFGFEGNFTAEEKERIRKRAIASLKNDPQRYKSLDELNQRAGFDITATPDELEGIIDTWLEGGRYQYREDPREIATSLHQELNPRQIRKKYIDILRYKRGSWEAQREARELFSKTQIPLVDEEVQDYLRWTTFRSRKDMMAFLEMFHDCAGYVPGSEYRTALFSSAYRKNDHEGMGTLIKICNGEKPDEDTVRSMVTGGDKSTSDRIKWLGTFKKLTGFTPSDSDRDALYREAYENYDRIKNVSLLIDATRKVPPAEIAQEVLREALERRDYGFVRFSWESSSEREKNNAINGLVKRLTHTYGVQLPSEQVVSLNEYVSQRNSISELSETIDKLGTIYNTKPELTEEQQRRLLQMVEQRVSEPYTRLKKSRDGQQVLGQWQGSRSVRAFTDETVRQEASTKAAELLASENIYQGYVYMNAVGVEPQFSPDQFDTFKQNLQTYERRFNKGDFENLQKLAEKQEVQ